MESKFSEDTIPQSIKEFLYRIPSDKVRRSFLAILENDWNRKNNNHKNL